MFSYTLILSALPGILFILCGSCSGKPNWQFELLEVHHWSSNEDLLNSNLVRKRLNRTTTVIDGEVQWNFEADITTTFEMQSYSSPNNGVYKVEPYEVPRQPLYTFLSSPIYQQVLYPTIAHCSNIPKVTGPYIQPV